MRVKLLGELKFKRWLLQDKRWLSERNVGCGMAPRPMFSVKRQGHPSPTRHDSDCEPSDNKTCTRASLPQLS